MNRLKLPCCLALEVFRGTPNVTAEVREMRQEAEAEAASGQMSALELLRDKTLHWQIMSIMLLQVAQQACGINAVGMFVIIYATALI